MTTPEGPAARGARPSTEAELKLLRELETARAQLTEAQEAARDHSSELHATVPSLRARLVEVERQLERMERLYKDKIEGPEGTTILRARALAAEARLSEVEGALRTAVERCIVWMQGAPEAAPLRGIRDLLIAEARAALTALSGSPPISGAGEAKAENTRQAAEVERLRAELACAQESVAAAQGLLRDARAKNTPLSGEETK